LRVHKPGIVMIPLSHHWLKSDVDGDAIADARDCSA
jgi:hypothetical protein